MVSAVLKDLARRSHGSPRRAEIFHGLASGEVLDRSQAELARELEPTEALVQTVCAALMARTALPDAPRPYVGYSPRGPLRTLPVRFPEPQYERLKAWSERHGFPIAVVVRGLVERFLDEQRPTSPPVAPNP